MGAMDDLASGLEMMKSVDWIAEMKPNGKNNRKWGDPNKADYLLRHLDRQFFSGVVSYEAQQIVHSLI